MDIRSDKQPTKKDSISLESNTLLTDGRNSGTLPSSKRSWVETFLKDYLPVLLNFVAIIAASGFVVINVYISKYTTIFTYNVSAGEYLAAGISVLLYVPLEISNLILQNFSASLRIAFLAFAVIALFILLKALSFVYRSRIKNSTVSITIANRIKNLSRKEFLKECRSAFTAIKLAFEDFFKFIDPIYDPKTRWKKFWRYVYYFYLGFGVVFAMLLALIYGQIGYEQMPRWSGGGFPSHTIILLKQDNLYGWPFKVTIAATPSVGQPSQPGQSQKLRMLLELTDGILVLNEDNGVAVEIKGDVINGIIDTDKPTLTTTPTITPSPTP